ncbi:J-type co-chaperone JAC1, mitochondrial [Cladophialophora carrionii]|uniref:J-type co-chaperone JAC1, mitochondrial n=1 Tax=Cladophialophora carrionii TaxID=86049 RepID=A0A1C1CAT9_9EURO|nr:J-type co-chaperone JAC1, mitochondrial [Cladophialophora carrionii]
MSRVIPSPQTLRLLRRLCALESPITTSTGAQTRTRPHQLRYLPIQYATNSDHSRRPFTTSRVHAQEAHPQPSPPQSERHASSTPAEDTPLPDITNYYTLFPQTLPNGPPPASSFSIPTPLLRREFLSLQSRYHPDKFPAGTASHQKSLALSSLLNTAYKTLSDPLLRARYLLLEKYGVDVTTEDNNIHSGLTDHETLLEVMEAQEALEEATSYEDIEKLMEENAARIRDTEEILGKAFENEDVDEAKKECVRLNYWRSLQGALKEWEPGKEVRLVH